MKPALLLEHAFAQRRALLATAEARVNLHAAAVAAELPGTPEHTAAHAKLLAAERELDRLRGPRAAASFPNPS